VNDAALQKLLPAGWETAIATQGPAKDANLRLIFIDRVDVTNPDNTPKTTDQLVYIAIPVKQTGTTNAGQMIINGLVSDAKGAPRPVCNQSPRDVGKGLTLLQHPQWRDRGRRELGIHRRQRRASGDACQI